MVILFHPNQQIPSYLSIGMTWYELPTHYILFIYYSCSPTFSPSTVSQISNVSGPVQVSLSTSYCCVDLCVSYESLFRKWVVSCPSLCVTWISQCHLYLMMKLFVVIHLPLLLSLLFHLMLFRMYFHNPMFLLIQGTTQFWPRKHWVNIGLRNSTSLLCNYSLFQM